MRSVFLYIVLAVVGFFVAGSPARAEAEAPLSLDGLWFTCEYAHSQIAPTDDCVMLDDDGFLVEGDGIWHMKVQDGDQQGCRGDRAGNCFLRERQKLTVKKEKIGEVERTPDGAIIDYMWCGQAYSIRRGAHWVEVRPSGDKCAWTSNKTYYVAKWPGQLTIVK